MGFAFSSQKESNQQQPSLPSPTSDTHQLFIHLLRKAHMQTLNSRTSDLPKSNGSESSLFTGEMQAFCLQGLSMCLSVQRSPLDKERHFVFLHNILNHFGLQSASFTQSGVTRDLMRSPLTLELLAPARIECYDHEGKEVIHITSFKYNNEYLIDSDEEFADFDEGYCTEGDE